MFMPLIIQSEVSTMAKLVCHLHKLLFLYMYLNCHKYNINDDFMVGILKKEVRFLFLLCFVSCGYTFDTPTPQVRLTNAK